MLGMGRTIREGELDDYELMIIRAKDGRVDYEAHPMMQPTAVFTATVVSDTLLQFENPRHDFPRLIAYQRRGTDSLVARIAAGPAGGDRQILFTYRRMPCGGPPVTPQGGERLGVAEHRYRQVHRPGTRESQCQRDRGSSRGASFRLSTITCRPRPILIEARGASGSTGTGRIPCPAASVCSIAAPAGDVTAMRVSNASPALLISMPTVAAFTSAALHATA
jgi:hypothetical protein